MLTESLLAPKLGTWTHGRGMRLPGMNLVWLLEDLVARVRDSVDIQGQRLLCSVDCRLVA